VARSLPALLAALACVPVAVIPLGGWVLPHATAPVLAAASGGAPSYRALTWNVEQWTNGGARLATLIQEARPDVFCLQEALNHGSFPLDRDFAAFEAALPDYHLLRYGEMAIGTRWPVLEERRTPLHRELWRRPLLEVVLQAPDGGRLRVLDAHLMYTGYFGKRPSSLVIAAGERLAQAERILAHVDASPALPTLLCGDLNAPPSSAALARLRERFRDAWGERGSGFGMTSSSSRPLRRIDYLLASGLTLGDVRVLEGTLSDHYALTTTFALGR
jgi:endonuclease/exonuclease/phosphatase (EEP) superfamily protein YafD